jgi:hypothetical protein
MSCEQDPEGGPAFPTENERQTGQHSYHYSGMTLRDYFAAAALTGYYANTPMHQSAEESGAKYAYRTADAMLLARKMTHEQLYY